MYLDFEDYRPDIQPIGRAISWREGVLLSIIFHLVVLVVLLIAPQLIPFTSVPNRVAVVPQQEAPRFVFVQPRRELFAPRVPDRADPSDRDRVARAPERAPKPADPLPFSRGNTPDRVDSLDQQPQRGQGPKPDPAEGANAQPAEEPAQTKLPESPGVQLPSQRPSTAQNNAGARATTPGGGLGDALRNLQRYVQRDTFENPQGGGGQFGPEIQFDTKGVEFGPWVRRFVAQVKRNWYSVMPQAAAMYKGHVVVTFNVHKDGGISDLVVIGPCPIDSFNTAAFGALKASNPTEPLPPEYPSDKAFFTVTFFYNEVPPR
jgi:outer membrane biosynthesis protein TonB